MDATVSTPAARTCVHCLLKQVRCHCFDDHSTEWHLIGLRVLAEEARRDAARLSRRRFADEAA